MRSLKEQVVSMGERMGGKLVDGLGEASIKLGEQTRGKCMLISFYEPKISMDLLQEHKEQ